MLKSPHPNLIESDEGFSVQVVGGGVLGIIYREGNRAIKVLSEPAVLPVGYIIHKNSITEWAPPGSGNIIDDLARARIIENLHKAFSFQGYQIRIEERCQFRDSLLHELQKLE